MIDLSGLGNSRHREDGFPDQLVYFFPLMHVLIQSINSFRLALNNVSSLFVIRMGFRLVSGWVIRLMRGQLLPSESNEFFHNFRLIRRIQQKEI